MVVVGNTKLVKYGIDEDESDYRIHVCPCAKKAYCYPTRKAKQLVKDQTFEQRSVPTKGLLTSRGFIVPVECVPDCQVIPLSSRVLARWNIRTFDSQRVKGHKAVAIAQHLLEQGLVRLPMETAEVSDQILQMKGQDVVATSKFSFQVKCDFKGGDKASGGTGNLFIQEKECNPYGIH